MPHLRRVTMPRGKTPDEVSPFGVGLVDEWVLRCRRIVSALRSTSDASSHPPALGRAACSRLWEPSSSLHSGTTRFFLQPSPSFDRKVFLHGAGRSFRRSSWVHTYCSHHL